MAQKFDLTIKGFASKKQAEEFLTWRKGPMNTPPPEPPCRRVTE